MSERTVSYLIKFADRFSPVLQKMQGAISTSIDRAAKMQKQVDKIPNSINALRARLDRYSESRDKAFRIDHIARYNEMIRKTQRELSRLENYPRKSFISRLFSIDDRFKSIARTAVAAFSIGAITSFGGKIVMATGQVEQYKLTLENMLGSKALADQRMNEYSKIAAKTPFEIQDVVELGNGLQALGKYSKSNILLLGDLAAAAGKPLDQVRMAYSKLATGQKGEAVNLFRDLLISTNDWVKATGKGVSKNGELMATTEEMLAVLPKIMKDKGFYGMMDKQSQGILGKISNLKDTWFQTLVQIGDSIRPLIDWVINGLGKAASGFQGMVTWITRNKEVIGALSKVVLTATVFFGGLKMTILAVKNATMLAKLAQGAYAMVIGLTTGKVELLTSAMKIFGVTSKAALIGSGIGILITLVATAAAAFYLFKKRTEDSTVALRKAKEMAMESYAQEKVGLDVLFRAMEKTNPKSRERAEIVKKLKEQYPDLNKELEKELLTTNNLATAYEALNKQILRKAENEAMSEVNKEKAKQKVQNLQRIDELDAELKQKKWLAEQRKKAEAGGTGATIPGTGGMGAVIDQQSINRLNDEKEKLQAQNRNIDAQMKSLADRLATSMVEEISSKQNGGSKQTEGQKQAGLPANQDYFESISPVNRDWQPNNAWDPVPGFNSGAGKGVNNNSNNSPAVTPSDLSGSIGSGGSGAGKTANINISLGTLVNTITINVADAKQGAAEIRDILMSELKQLLNSANKLALD
ncbi:MAG: hypothetical protein PHU33_16490 [Bacteroidales bacterium]|nr:hypothetical protein [Bacteroidales bacterium]